MLKGLWRKLQSALRVATGATGESGSPAENRQRTTEDRQAEYAVLILHHTVCAEMTPGQEIKARFQLQNIGWKTWHCATSLATRVELMLRWDGTVIRTISLPEDDVPPAGIVVIPAEFLAPQETGTHILSVDLVEQGVAFFEDAGWPPLHLLIQVREGPLREEPPEYVRTAPLMPPKYSALYLEHNLPHSAPAGTRLGAWFTVRNTGTLLWHGIQIDRVHPVDLLVTLNDRLMETIHLPVPKVRTGEAVTLFFSIPLPQETGRHELQFSLIRQNDCFFSALGVDPFVFEITTQQENLTQSTDLFEKAMQMNSWFYMPSHGVVGNAAGSKFPLFARSAKGCFLLDTEGTRFIDYTSGWGCNLLGYADERVNAAVRSALEDSAILPLPHPVLVEVSELLCETIPSAEMTAFGKNGSDVCSLAVRLARAATGRRTILVCGYHGFQDWYAELAGFTNSGVPDRETTLIYRFRFNDWDSFRWLLQRHRQDLAAVMLEPSGPGEEPQGPSMETDIDFLRMIAAETRKAGALLIFDEIITGFRYLAGSVQKQTGIVPDLTCLGKALGNGMPIAALVGRREIMMTHMPRTFYGPTFKDETLSLAAAKACLEIYRNEPVSNHVWRFGARMIRDTNSLCRSLDLPAAMLGPAFRFSFHFKETDAYRLIQLRTLYQQELMKRRILTYNGIMLPNYAHTEIVYEETMEAMQGALEVVRQAMRDGRLHRFIEMPLISR